MHGVAERQECRQQFFLLRTITSFSVVGPTPAKKFFFFTRYAVYTEVRHFLWRTKATLILPMPMTKSAMHLYLVAYLSSYHVKAVNALYEFA